MEAVKTPLPSDLGTDAELEKILSAADLDNIVPGPAKKKSRHEFLSHEVECLAIIFPRSLLKRSNRRVFSYLS